MAIYDLEEQEQISELKAWWEQYGKYVTGLAVIAAVASVAWQGLNWYQNKQASEAGALYSAVQAAVGKREPARTREAAGQLIEKFPGSIYADMAAMVSANLQFAEGDARNARAHLEWVVANGNDPILRDLARLRLATVMFDEGAGPDALKQLEPAPVEGLRFRFEDLRGDILALDGKPAEARKAYQAALDLLAAQGAVAGGEPLVEVIRVKLESLEG